MMLVKPDKYQMCLLGHLLFLLPIWALGFSFLSVASVIKSEESSVVFVSATSHEIPISQASPRMGAQSPGPPIVKVVFREDLNKKILIALIVSSTLLCVTVMFLLYLLLWRYRNLKNSDKPEQVYYRRRKRIVEAEELSGDDRESQEVAELADGERL